MDKLEIFRGIAAEAGRGDITFPANVKGSLKLQLALDDDDCHIDAAAKLVMAEPLLSAYTVAVANSVAYNRSGNEITNVRMAVTRLGFRTLKTMVGTLIVRQLNSAIRDPQLRALSAALWEHTAHVAALAQVLARKVSKIDPDTAMFAATMHEAGGFYLLVRAEAFPGLMDDNSEAWIGYGEKLIGRGVLRQLGVPAQILEAVDVLWQGVPNYPPRTLGDTLLLANELAQVASPLRAPRSAHEREAIEQIDFDVNGSTLRRILRESQEEIDSLTAALLS
jgi:hypothetical protein